MQHPHLRLLLICLLLSVSNLGKTAEPSQQQPTYKNLAALSERANAGDVKAQLHLAEVFERGQLVTQNFEQAFLWRKRAAAEGDAEAQNALGRHYAEGLGTEFDAQLASQYMRLAAEQGQPQHQHDYAQLLNRDVADVHDAPQAVRWYTLAVGQQFIPAFSHLGLMYYQGRGVEKNVSKAIELLEVAANEGIAEAQNTLGVIYVRGDGVSQNHELAFKWFEKASEQNLAEAKTNLAVMYENGFGVQFDEQKAKQLYREGGQQGAKSLSTVLARIGIPFDQRLQKTDQETQTLAELTREAQAGDPVAQYLLAQWYLVANNPASNNRAAADWFKQSALSGNNAAMLNLGIMYMNGRGLPQDYVSGYFWISKAAGRGHGSALSLRDELFPFLTSKQIQAALKLVKPTATD